MMQDRALPLNKAIQQLVGEVLEWGSTGSKEELLARLDQAETK